MKDCILEARNISKSFHDPVTFGVLFNISFDVYKGEFVALTGKSGCGKSSLLYILSTMDTDYEGELFIDSMSMHGKKESQLARVRNEKIGFVFQFHYLLNEFSVLKNVMLPALKLGNISPAEAEQKAMDKLRILHIDQLASKNANRISGGEKQRVAIARALINDPHIIIDIFKQLAEEYNQTLFIVTHDMDFAKRTDRVLEMEDGHLIS
jgi:lipoprotein-releasing system ATP-binding protein